MPRRNTIRSCSRTVTVAQAKRYWQRSGPGAKHRARYMSDPDAVWQTARGGVWFIAPKYLYGVEFVCDHGQIVGYAMDISSAQALRMRRKRFMR